MLPPPTRRAINMNRLGRILTDDEGGRVEVLFVQGSNPAATCPQQAIVLQGLARDDLFTVVHDLTMTDTARFADLVLPATSQFEVDEVVGSYGSFVDAGGAGCHPSGRRESHQRRGQCRCRHSPRSRSSAVGSEARSASGGWLSAIGCCPSPSVRIGGIVQFRDVDPGGRVQLVFDADGVDPLACLSGSIELPDLPITLITPATSRTTSSMFGNIAPASA